MMASGLVGPADGQCSNFWMESAIVFTYMNATVNPFLYAIITTTNCSLSGVWCDFDIDDDQDNNDVKDNEEDSDENEKDGKPDKTPDQGGGRRQKVFDILKFHVVILKKNIKRG